MVSELQVGDEVLTAGGIYGTILAIDDDEITVEIAPQTKVRVARQRDRRRDDRAGAGARTGVRRARGAGSGGRRGRRTACAGG